ncbi:unnamed protein product [Rangifer tarandus platyrhynchus]|uniref:Uncharacterized protein n=1 Tax=Rangifer tarandus platyrhynchus TaxID=3082113 RepID=A0AC59YIC6_RANTA
MVRWTVFEDVAPLSQPSPGHSSLSAEAGSSLPPAPQPVGQPPPPLAGAGLCWACGSGRAPGMQPTCPWCLLDSVCGSGSPPQHLTAGVLPETLQGNTRTTPPPGGGREVGGELSLREVCGGGQTSDPAPPQRCPDQPRSPAAFGGPKGSEDPSRSEPRPTSPSSFRSSKAG